MSKIEKLLDKTRRKGDTKKWKMYVFAVVGILIVVGGFCGILTLLNPVFDNYFGGTERMYLQYDFYELEKENPPQHDTVYFVGSSYIGCSIDSDEINRILHERGYTNITAYNLGQDGLYSLGRSLQIQNIIDSAPSLVILGESYDFASDASYVNILSDDARIRKVHDRLDVRQDALSLYSEDLLKLIFTPAVFDKKSFLKPAIDYLRSGGVRKDISNVTDYYMITGGGALGRYNAENDPNYPHVTREKVNGVTVSSEMNTAKEAIIYNAKTLHEAGIPVVIISTPLHPFSSEKITDETRQNFFDMLNTTGVKWYDYEFALPDESCWYKDGRHVAPFTGAKTFAPVMADLIIQEMT